MNTIKHARENQLKWIGAANGWTYAVPATRENENADQCVCSCNLDELKPYQIPLELIAKLNWDDQTQRRWRYLFGQRIQATLAGSTDSLPQLFAGEAPVFQSAPVNRIDGQAAYLGDFYLDQLNRLRSSMQSFENPRIGPVLKRANPGSSWPWRYIDQVQLIEVIPNRHGCEIVLGKEHASFSETEALLKEPVALLRQNGKQTISIAETEAVLTAFHRVWSPAASPTFSASALIVARHILSKEIARPDSVLIALLFELEAFASYSTILENFELKASGFFRSHWLDVGSLNIERIRGTEQCQSVRLYHELLGFVRGHTSPILINEYHCVADGNHRLTAAWIWNILSSVKSANWCLDCEEFQTAVRDYVCQFTADTQVVSIHQALYHLGFFLSHEHYRDSLVRELKERRQIFEISSLPVAPLLEYNSLTVIGEEFDKSRRFFRFAPNTYEFLIRQSNMVLPARACYHFTDKVPLPWFSFAEHILRDSDSEESGSKQFSGALSNS